MSSWLVYSRVLNQRHKKTAPLRSQDLTAKAMTRSKKHCNWFFQKTIKSPHQFIIPILLLGFILPVAHLNAPPRFDETGYAILAKSIADGRGYCEIDKPNAPPHAHFPPAWPWVLGLAWQVIPTRIFSITQSAHLISVVFWLTSVLLFHKWFQRVRPESATPLGLALAFNWLWIRFAGELRSESLFIACSAVIFFMMDQSNPKASHCKKLVGLVVGLSILSRQVGIALAMAVFIEFLCRKETRQAISSVVISCFLVLPWVIWQWSVGGGTQAELLAKDEQARSLIRRLADQSSFYVQRLPDSLFGPYIETATVFNSSINMALAATLLAVFFSLICLAGFIRMAISPETRFAAIYCGITMAILIVWPFTEAGRFLIPLIPIMLLALANGLAILASLAQDLGWIKSGNHQRIVWLIPMLSILFGMYTWQKNLRTSPMNLDKDFDQACAWIAQHLPPNSIIASRHPGDVFWRSGRTGLPWPNQTNITEAANQLAKKNVGFLLVDRGRFVGDKPATWLEPENLKARPDLFQPVLMEGLTNSPTKLWRILKPTAPQPHSS